MHRQAKVVKMRLSFSCLSSKASAETARPSQASRTLSHGPEPVCRELRESQWVGSRGAQQTQAGLGLLPRDPPGQPRHCVMLSVATASN